MIPVIGVSRGVQECSGGIGVSRVITLWLCPVSPALCDGGAEAETEYFQRYRGLSQVGQGRVRAVKSEL